MIYPRKIALRINELIEAHPNGSHFCTTSRESGYALNAEDLSVLLAGYGRAVRSLMFIADNDTLTTIGRNKLISDTLKLLGEEVE